jgi:hypothetical protein
LAPGFDASEILQIKARDERRARRIETYAAPSREKLQRRDA